MSKNLDKIFLGVILGGTFPLMFLLVATALWFYTDHNEQHALLYAAGGIFVGLLVDMRYLRSWINRLYELHSGFLIALYVFYNVGILGMFMGVPVFNLLTGLLAGYYMGKRLLFSNAGAETQAKAVRQVALFTVLIMVMICILSGLLAITDGYTGKNLQGMLGLSHEVSKSLILIIILTGGSALTLLQYLITRTVMIRTMKQQSP